jgi:hypothetical protein
MWRKCLGGWRVNLDRGRGVELTCSGYVRCMFAASPETMIQRMQTGFRRSVVVSRDPCSVYTA